MNHTRVCNTRPPIPPTFIDPLLRQLGKATKFQPFTYHPSTEIYRRTLLEMGINPDNLEQHGAVEDGWRMYGVSGVGGLVHDGLARRIWYAFRSLHYRKVNPLTLLGDKKGTWGLTPEGVRRARRVNSGNVTSQFLDRRLRETGGLNGTLMTLLRATLTKKLPVSAAYGKIDDHIQSCFLKLIKNDSFRLRMAEGHRVTDSQIVMFAIRTGYTQIRNAGTEPVERERCGARTEREREKELPEPTCGGDPKIIWDPENYGEYDLVDTDSPLRPEATQDHIEFYGLWTQVETLIKRKRDKTGPQFVRVLWGVDVEGFTIKEIAEREDITAHRASFLLSQARGLVKEAVTQGQLIAP